MNRLGKSVNWSSVNILSEIFPELASKLLMSFSTWFLNIISPPLIDMTGMLITVAIATITKDFFRNLTYQPLL